MRLLQMIDSLAIGGAQRLLITLAKELQLRDVSLMIVTLGRDEQQPVARALADIGVPIHYFPARRLRDPRRFAGIMRFLRAHPVDVIHTHLFTSNILGALAGRLTHTPVVTTLHSTRTDLRRPRRSRIQGETLALRYGANRVLAVGHTVAEAHRARLAGKPITVIPNAVAPLPSLPRYEWESVRRDVVGDAERPILISVGRLERPKGYEDLLTAFAIVHNRLPSAALVIVGDGSLQSELSTQISRLELAGHAFLTGARDDVPRLLAASDIFVSSSHWEGLPVSLLEGMAAGLPVVATSVGDVSRVVVDGSGLIVPPHAPQELAAAVETLLTDPDKRRVAGAAAKAQIERYYTPAVWVDRLLALYTEVCSSARPVHERQGKA